LWIVSAVTVLSALAAARAPALDVEGRCSVRFFGTSTLHDFEGTAPCALLAIAAPDASGHYGARAEVAIAQMDTGISSRDKKMRAMFEAKKYPRIVATFASVDPAALRAAGPSALPFRIALHGVERDVAPAISRFVEVPGKSARFRATFTLALSDFGLEAPVALGFIQVDDKVRVEVDVELAAKNGGEPPTGAPQQ
jgi:hypothetical protein